AIVEDLIGRVFDGNISPFKNLWYNPATTAPDSNYDPSAAPQYGFIDLSSPSGQNVFPMGGKFDNVLSETPFVFDLGEVPETSFLFIMEASYGHTTIRWTRQEPRYFLPEFHRKDALYVKAEIVQNDLIANATESSAVLRVEIVDWQAGIAPSGSWNYSTSNLYEIRNASDVNGLILDIPGVLNSPIGGGIADLTGAGTLLEPYVWLRSFTNEEGAANGTYWGLVGVRDDLQGKIQAPLGVSSDVMNPVQMHDISSYQSFEVAIETLNIPPVADINVSPNPVWSFANLTCSVGVNCTDPDGTIVKYEYDFDYSGTTTTFTPDVTQNSGDPDFGFPVITQLDDSKQFFNVAQRVTDNIGATNIDFVIVEVWVNQSPVADIDVAPNPIRVSRDVTLSVGVNCNDPDGAIVKYEYDFTYDLITFNPDVTQTPGPGFGNPVITQYPTAGSYNVAQRVTDDRGGIDIDYVVLTVNPNQNPVADLTATPDPVRACADLTVSRGPLCDDPDGDIVKYEYDFHYSGNPATFNPEVTQNPGPGFGDDVITQYDQTELGNHLVAQRVTDDLGATNIDFVNIQVIANQAPTADLQDNDADNIVDNGDTVTFQPGPLTDDPDGSITKYEYDWDYNGTTFTADVTQNPGPGFGNPVAHQFTNGTASDIYVTVATRVTDDGCPNLTDIDSTQFTVHPPPDFGLPIDEHFETTTPGFVPTDWGVTGRFGQAYYISTSGSTCSNTTWRWGVTNNASQGSDSGSPGETRFLNENGYAWPASDQTYTYMNRATIVYTPEIIVPPTGATLTIRHWYDTTYVDNWLVGWHALDGGRPIVSLNNPGAITWTDFCNNVNYDHRPWRPLNVASGPGYHGVGNTVSGNHPLWSMQAHTHSETDFTPSWRTNIYSLNAYIGQTIRVGFLFGSDDIDMETNGDCDPRAFSGLDIYAKAGWRIHWVKIDAN
ncbi:PKD domain-containing protein, partial [bacterium]|nr:PKD domain-containing protein [bacterium]MBU1024711.1 PKD domain-containing protein [bacterium]